MAQIILDSNSNLIQGDFDSATVNNRTKLQTSTTNATTGVYVVPNGSATSASIQMANAADPTNASKLVVATNGSTDTQIVSGANGTGTYLPLSFYTNNDIRFQMGTAGELNVRTAPGTVSSGTSGQFLTSNGPGAGVSWTTAPTPPSGQIQTQIFTSPGTWTKPASCTQVKVTVVGGGGGTDGLAGKVAGAGGLAIAISPVSGPVAVTIGSGGSPGNVAGGTSSFGSLVSATGGGIGPSPGTSWGTPGVGTVTTGTDLTSGSNGISRAGLGSLTFAPTSSDGGAFINGLHGRTAGNAGSTAITYTPSLGYIAGAAGGNPSPATPAGTAIGGVSGAVVVEFVG